MVTGSHIVGILYLLDTQPVVPPFHELRSCPTVAELCQTQALGVQVGKTTPHEAHAPGGRTGE